MPMSDILNTTAYEYGHSCLSEIDELRELSRYANEISYDIKMIALMAEKVEGRITINNVDQAFEDASALADYLKCVELRLRGTVMQANDKLRGTLKDDRETTYSYQEKQGHVAKCDVCGHVESWGVRPGDYCHRCGRKIVWVYR